MPLSLAPKETGPRPRKVVVYGEGGIGKSTFAASAPKPVFVPTEDGVQDLTDKDGNPLDVAAFPVSQDLKTFVTYLNELINEEHDFETVVVDSADWLLGIIESHICNQKSVEHVGDIGGFGKGYSLVTEAFEKVLSKLDDLVAKGLHVVIICHEECKTITDPEVGEYDSYDLKLPKGAKAKLKEWTYEGLFCRWETVTKQLNKDKTAGAKTGRRVFYSQKSPGHWAKSRLAMPELQVLDWANYSKHFTTTKAGGAK